MPINRIDIAEFRRLGFLQEANRIFFHPLGLALEVIIDKETGEEKLGGVWDSRDDPVGICFRFADISQAKIGHVAALKDSKSASRMRIFGGHTIQCIPWRKRRRDHGNKITS